MLVLFVAFAHADNLTIPNSYGTGDRLTAQNLNNNMNAVKSSIDDNNGRININASDIAALIADVNALKAQIGSTTGSGINFTKLHTADELGLGVSGSVDIGSVANIKGLLLEWRMANRQEVFQQFVYLSDYDKSVITGAIQPPANYPRRYTTIVSDSFGTMMWLGVSITGTTLTVSTNSTANPQVSLERIFSFN